MALAPRPEEAEAGGREPAPGDRHLVRGVEALVLVEPVDVELSAVAPGNLGLVEGAPEEEIGAHVVELDLVVDETVALVGQPLDGKREEGPQLAPGTIAPASLHPGECVAGVAEAVSRHQPPAADVHGEASPAQYVLVAQRAAEAQLGPGLQQLHGVHQARVDRRVAVGELRARVLELGAHAEPVGEAKAGAHAGPDRHDLVFAGASSPELVVEVLVAGAVVDGDREPLRQPQGLLEAPGLGCGRRLGVRGRGNDQHEQGAEEQSLQLPAPPDAGCRASISRTSSRCASM